MVAPSQSSAFLPDIATLRALGEACGYDSAAVAARLGLSARHLRRLFRSQLGRTAATWLREERLQSALRRLPTARSVKQVAHALGFRSASQFCRDFRARFGVTPSEYLPEYPWHVAEVLRLSRALTPPSALDLERPRQSALGPRRE